MGTFLGLLSLELDSLNQNDFYEPEAELQTDDQIVGDLSEGLIRLFTLWRLTDKQVAAKIMEAKFEHLSVEGVEETIIKVRELNNKAELLRDLFWIEVKDEYHLWDKDNIGVRKGRKVVWFKESGPKIFGIGL